MKARIVILIVVLVFLFAGSVATAQPNGQGPSVLYTVQQGVMGSESYHLTSLTWEVGGVVSGTGYHLTSPSSPAGTGTPCCCSYLPCIVRAP